MISAIGSVAKVSPGGEVKKMMHYFGVNSSHPGCQWKERVSIGPFINMNRLFIHCYRVSGGPKHYF